MLKAQMHIHAREDPQDYTFVKYSAKELIDEAAKHGFEVLAFTCHNKVIHSQELDNYARKKNILLISGVEKEIKGKHVLIYNITEEESKRINSFSQLKKWRDKKQKENQPFLVVAPHPFFVLSNCLGDKVVKYLGLFDAWEYSFFYTQLINRNKKMLRLAKKYNKPILGNADVHKLTDLPRTYSVIDSDKQMSSIFKAIRNKQLEIKTKPIPLLHFFKTFLLFFVYGPLRFLKKI